MSENNLSQEVIDLLSDFKVKYSSTITWPEQPTLSVDWFVQRVVNTGEITNHVFRFKNKGNHIYTYETDVHANMSGTISRADIKLHTPTKGGGRFFGIKGIGRHNEIIMVLYLAPSGQDEWVFDGEIGINLGDFGCGRKGLKTEMNFVEGVAQIAFWVGRRPDSDPNLRCKIRVEHDGMRLVWRNGWT